MKKKICDVCTDIATCECGFCKRCCQCASKNLMEECAHCVMGSERVCFECDCCPDCCKCVECYDCKYQYNMTKFCDVCDLCEICCQCHFERGIE